MSGLEGTKLTVRLEKQSQKKNDGLLVLRPRLQTFFFLLLDLPPLPEVGSPFAPSLTMQDTRSRIALPEHRMNVRIAFLAVAIAVPSAYMIFHRCTFSLRLEIEGLIALYMPLPAH